jgi:ElaB/YqjD/DUF883 family membrane-anchored ribosome-binding protein
MDPQESFGTSMAGSVGETMEKGKEAYEKAQQYGSEAYQKTSETLGQAYDKTAKAVGETYDQAMAYGRQNPALMTLIALGIGVGVGLMLAGSVRRTRTRSFSEPIVEAISDFASEYLR